MACSRLSQNVFTFSEWPKARATLKCILWYLLELSDLFIENENSIFREKLWTKNLLLSLENEIYFLKKENPIFFIKLGQRLPKSFSELLNSTTFCHCIVFYINIFSCEIQFIQYNYNKSLNIFFIHFAVKFFKFIIIFKIVFIIFYYIFFFNNRGLQHQVLNVSRQRALDRE